MSSQDDEFNYVNHDFQEWVKELASNPVEILPGIAEYGKKYAKDFFENVYPEELIKKLPTDF